MVFAPSVLNILLLPACLAALGISSTCLLWTTCCGKKKAKKASAAESRGEPGGGEDETQKASGSQEEQQRLKEAEKPRITKTGIQTMSSQHAIRSTLTTRTAALASHDRKTQTDNTKSAIPPDQPAKNTKTMMSPLTMTKPNESFWQGEDEVEQMPVGKECGNLDAKIKVKKAGEMTAGLGQKHALSKRGKAKKHTKIPDPTTKEATNVIFSVSDSVTVSASASSGRSAGPYDQAQQQQPQGQQGQFPPRNNLGN